MDLSPYFKSVVDQDRCPVVLCDLSHTVLYMNPAAVKRYDKRGGIALVGQSLLNCHDPKSNEMIQRGVAWFQAGRTHDLIYTFHSDKENKDVYMVALRDESGGYYEKHEYRDRETMKRYDLEP